MGWSPLSTEVHSTSQHSSRIRPPAGVVLHHGATTSADAIISMETTGSRQVSSHQVVKDKRNAGIVQEQFRAWSLSDSYWDSWAFTVECANESTVGWTISAESHETLAQLTANWATRYGFWPHRSGPANTWTVIGHREVYTIHGGSYATACPGGMDLDWIAARAQQILQGSHDKRRNDAMPQMIRVVNSSGSSYTGITRLVGDTGQHLDINEKSEATLIEQLNRFFKGETLNSGGLSMVQSALAKVAPKVTAVEVDEDAIALSVAKKLVVPTAAENGKAARDAIVKP